MSLNFYHDQISTKECMPDVRIELATARTPGGRASDILNNSQWPYWLVAMMSNKTFEVHVLYLITYTPILAEYDEFMLSF